MKKEFKRRLTKLFGEHMGVKVNSDVTKEAIACGMLEEGNKVKIKQIKVTPRKTYELCKKCEHCRGWDNRCGANYCPMCGRKLEVRNDE